VKFVLSGALWLAIMAATATTYKGIKTNINEHLARLKLVCGTAELCRL
jgi:hypothetical protein